MSSMSVLIPIFVFWLAIGCVVTVGCLWDTIRTLRRPPAARRLMPRPQIGKPLTGQRGRSGDPPAARRSPKLRIDS
jgi:hypothetical protein